MNIAGKRKAPVPFHEIYKQLSFDHRKIYKYEEISELIEKLQEFGHGSVIEGQREGKCLKAKKHWPMEEPKIKYLPNYRSFSPALSN